ncbi:MAG: glycosyltransferase [Myxococcales bacterium]|nr:glycosyltransferase [Myxococcales bacterium]
MASTSPSSRGQPDVSGGAAAPRVSVVMPARNAEATLGLALESVLASQDVSLELLVVDDGSRDATRALAEGAMSRDARVRVVRGAGAGIAQALNLGVALARAELIARMDADDWCHPERLAAQVARFAADPSERLGALGTRVGVFGAAPSAGFMRFVGWQNSLVTAVEHARDLFVDAPLCHPSVMLRRSTLLAVGGYDEGDVAEDYELFLRMDRAGYTLEKLPRELLRWRRHEGQTTFTDPRFSVPSMRALKARYLAPALAASERKLVVWGAGRDGRRFARALQPFGLAPRAFVDIDPKKLGRIAQGAPIVRPEQLRPETDVVVASVGVEGARELIRDHLLGIGMVEGEGFFCVA